MTRSFTGAARSHGCLQALLLGLALLPGLAAAQYQWRNADGRMVYSDLPPPAHVEPARILRAPAVSPRPSSATGDAAAAPSVEGGAAQPRTWAEKAEAFRKRRADRAKAAAAREDAQRQAARKRRECEDMQASLRLLQSGRRIARMNAQGERVLLSAGERSERADEVRDGLASRCGEQS
ncbi:MAG: DUF4124 domain-containing protein [Burkholderiales bacterium]|nr:MAG: DUF4124 domain-containing protein [Burkholderiales bacterium]